MSFIMKINVDFIYPIGSIYMSVNSTNPGTLFGGTWSQLKDRFLLGAGNTYTNGNTGGAATVTLTVNQMPKHSHTVYRSTETGSFFGLTGISPSQTTQYAVNTTEAGNNEAHNNMPPYLVVYMWKRTA